MTQITNSKFRAAALVAAMTVAGLAIASAVNAARASSTLARHARIDAARPALAATPVAVAAPAAVDPRAGGFEVALGEWSVGLEAKAIRPGRVTIVVANRGKFVHGFEIQAAGSRRGDDDDDEGLETGRLRPGQSVRLTLDLKPGVYEVECFVGDHDEMGMVATLTVRADAPLVAAPKAQTNSVAIKNFAFRPALLRAKVGATVRWRNQDPAPHTATANDRSFDSKVLARNAGYTRKFTRPGTYAYICSLHPQMTGRIVVR